MKLKRTILYTILLGLIIAAMVFWGHDMDMFRNVRMAIMGVIFLIPVMCGQETMREYTFSVMIALLFFVVATVLHTFNTSRSLSLLIHSAGNLFLLKSVLYLRRLSYDGWVFLVLAVLGVLFFVEYFTGLEAKNYYIALYVAITLVLAFQGVVLFKKKNSLGHLYVMISIFLIIINVCIWGVALFVLDISLLKHFSQMMYWGLITLIAHTATLKSEDFKQVL